MIFSFPRCDFRMGTVWNGMLSVLVVCLERLNVIPAFVIEQTAAQTIDRVEAL